MLVLTDEAAAVSTLLRASARVEKTRAVRMLILMQPWGNHHFATEPEGNSCKADDTNARISSLIGCVLFG